MSATSSAESADRMAAYLDCFEHPQWLDRKPSRRRERARALRHAAQNLLPQ